MDINKIKKLINKGYSQRKIADSLGIGQTTLRYWLKKYNLNTKKALKVAELKECLNCEKKWNKKVKHPTQKFCDNKCQRAYEWKLKKERIEQGEVFYHRAMKKYLIEKYGNKCLNKKCGWDWSKPCGVDLEHIDGNSSNNKLENLTLLCPNCHSDTDTYKGKNKGKGRHARKIRYQEGKSY